MPSTNKRAATDWSSNVLSPEQVARYLSVSPETLKRWRKRKFGPRFVRINRRVIRYHRADVDNFLDRQTVSTNGRRAARDR